MLHFEQRFGPSAIRLVHGNHGAAVGPAAHFHHAESQRLDQFSSGAGIALAGGDHETPRLVAVHLPLPHAIEIAQQFLAMQRGVVQQRVPRDSLVVDDVLQAPRAAGPRLRIIPGALARIVAQGGSGNLVRRERNGRGDAHASRLGEDAQAAVERLVVARGRPEIVNRMDGDAGLAGGGEVGGNGGPIHIHFLHQDGIDIRFGGVEPWRHEQARCVGALLVNVVNDFGMPDIVQRGDGEARLHLRENVPVAIVVVAHVVVVQLRRRSAFERRAESLAVPARHDVDAIGIERGHQQHDVVLEDGAVVRGVIGEDAVGEFHGGVGGGDFGGMDGAGHQHHGLAFEEEFLSLCLRGFARVGELLLDGDIAVEMLEGFGIGDGGGNERPAFGAFAEFFDADAVAGFLQRLEVAHHPIPVEHRAVVGELMAEVALRGRYGGCCGPGKQHQRDQGASKHPFILCWGAHRGKLEKGLAEPIFFKANRNCGAPRRQRRDVQDSVANPLPHGVPSGPGSVIPSRARKQAVSSNWVLTRFREARL